MKRFLPVVVAFVPAAVFLGARGPAALPASDSKMATPRYDETGALVRPEGFERWTFVGANIGMSYAEEAQAGPGEFHNIYTQPEAYAAYAATGRFPEKTMFLLVVHEPAQKVSINKSGYFEGPMKGLAVSVKDREHSPEGWAFYSFGEAGKLAATAKAAPAPMCYECHARHADDDRVFVQFHPILRQARPRSP
jgi:hypothetical protein